MTELNEDAYSGLSIPGSFIQVWRASHSCRTSAWDRPSAMDNGSSWRSR